MLRACTAQCVDKGAGLRAVRRGHVIAGSGRGAVVSCRHRGGESLALSHSMLERTLINAPSLFGGAHMALIVVLKKIRVVFRLP